MKKSLISLFIEKYGLISIIIVLFISANIGIFIAMSFLLILRFIGI